MNTRKLLLELINQCDIHDVCFIEGCDREDTDMAQLKRFDPIDHEDIFLMLCPEHEGWAKQRNVLAEQIREDFRECRREIGARYADEIGSVEDPEFDEIDVQSIVTELAGDNV